MVRVESLLAMTDPNIETLRRALDWVDPGAPEADEHRAALARVSADLDALRAELRATSVTNKNIGLAGALQERAEQAERERDEAREALKTFVRAASNLEPQVLGDRLAYSLMVSDVVVEDARRVLSEGEAE